MSYYRLLQNDLVNEFNLTETLKGVFINTAYESNRYKCAEAYLENFLYDENVDKDTTVARLRDLCHSRMLPIREIESNRNNLCSIKCEDYDVQVEIQNTGPFSFQLDNEVFVLPPIPNKSLDFERLKIDVSPRQTFIKPIVVPKFEIANIINDVFQTLTKTERVWSSMLFQTYGDIGEDLFKIFLAGGQFLPSGYVVSKSAHEPPNMRTVTIEPFEKFVMKTCRPYSASFLDMFSLIGSIE